MLTDDVLNRLLVVKNVILILASLMYQIFKEVI